MFLSANKCQIKNGGFSVQTDFSLKIGHHLSLFGPSGSGKSSLQRESPADCWCAHVDMQSNSRICSRWPPFSQSRHHFGSLQLSRAPKGPQRQQRRESAKKPPEMCLEPAKNRQDSAENLSRFRREPAEDPPYEPLTKIISTLRRLRRDFVPR